MKSCIYICLQFHEQIVRKRGNKEGHSLQQLYFFFLFFFLIMQLPILPCISNFRSLLECQDERSYPSKIKYIFQIFCRFQSDRERDELEIVKRSQQLINFLLIILSEILKSLFQSRYFGPRHSFLRCFG
eukprot:TRINITY_DN4302_c0_g2_i2.p1 TRINITY_DN4302_c0_g2~~TRINITY_DN4302_c0_g2_i2.p1  ORF type:complete len:129 (+),score=1.23 TRINITY_DN4302_c0_g2_i2:300-686(+)